MKSKYFLIQLSFILILSAGCKKFIEIPPPNTQLIGESVFSNDATSNAALLGLYSQIPNTLRITYYTALYTGLSGDEFINYSTSPDMIQLYNNGLLATNALTQNLWNNFYSIIYQANAILEGTGSSTGVSDPVKKQIIAEAKFIRAYSNFYLVNFFGNIPLILTTNYAVNNVSTRTEVAKVYLQIVADLRDAQAGLNDKFVGGDGITPTTEKLRPTKFAATALLARVYLYLKDYPNAEAQASVVINATSNASLEPDLTKVFLKNSSEAIWETTNTVNNALEASFFTLTTTPNNNLPVSLQTALVNSFDAADKRKVNWVGSFTNTIGIFYYPTKYKNNTITSLTEYSMMLRLGEQYLIRAEARTQQDKLVGANSGTEDLNSIRKRAGLLNYSGPANKDSIQSAILRERKIELFSEGQRWFDLKRTGNVDKVMGSFTPVKGSTWNTYQQLYPIPQIDRSNNPNLSQNLGY